MGLPSRATSLPPGTRIKRRLRLFCHILLYAALSSPLVLGCDLPQGLTDVGSSLTNPDAALLDRPGRKIASGSYRRLLIDGSLKDGGHVIAIRSDRGEDEVAIVPYMEGKACHIAPGLEVDRASSKVDVEIPGLVAVQKDKDERGRGEVVFVDFDCDEVIDSLPGTVIPQILFPPLNPRGLLALTDTGDLYLVDVRSRSLEPVARNVTLARTSGDHLWTVEDGELVGRDTRLSEFARTGSGVREFVITGGTSIMTAYLDESGLHAFSVTAGARKISETGCAITTWGADSVVYFDPGEESKINVYTLGSRIGSSAEFVYLAGPPGVVLPERALPFWGQGFRDSEAIVLLRTTNPTGGQLVVARVAAEPEETDGQYLMDVEILEDDGALIRGGQIYRDWNGQSGTLVELEVDETGRTVGMVALADSVAQLPAGVPYTPAGVLTDFDGTVGTLRSLLKTSDGVKSTVIAEDVPIQVHTVDLETGRRAFIGDSEDGTTGTLYVSDAPSVNTSVPRVRAIADDVYAETARFLEQPRAVVYLAKGAESGQGVLKAWLFDSQLTLTIHKQVSEYRTVPWPAPGILYAVPSGSDRGLWFSKAR
jgi:hypothetical protein